MSLQKMLQSQLDKSGAPSIAAAIIVDGKLSDLDAVGVRKEGLKNQVQLNDKYHLCLCNMAITATLVARLIEKRRISWDLHLKDAFKNVPIHPDYEDITLRQLLNHNAGFLPFIDEELWQHLGAKAAPEQRRILAGNLLSRPFLHPIEHHFEYADPNYLLVGAIVEAVTGESFEHLMQKELFVPLKMLTAGFGLPAKTEQIDQPWGHSPDPIDPFIYGDEPKALSPVGITHCSLEDWVKFAILHLKREAQDFISIETFSDMYSFVEEANHGMGWMLNRNHRQLGQMFWMGGGNTMFFSMISLYPAQKVGILISTNIGGQKGEELCLNTSLQLESYYLS